MSLFFGDNRHDCDDNGANNVKDYDLFLWHDLDYDELQCFMTRQYTTDASPDRK